MIEFFGLGRENCLGRGEVKSPFLLSGFFSPSLDNFSFITGHKQCAKILNLNLLLSGHIMSFIIIKSLSLTCRM